jgi:hypothetical protein
VTPLLNIAAFPLALRGEWDLAGERFTLVEPFIYNDTEKGVYVSVPAGFETDFSSIPRAVWMWFPKTQYPAAGLIHDRLYDEPVAWLHGVRTALNRGQCDDIWRRILHLSGCRRTKRVSAWLALRAGGWLAWQNHRQRDRT